MANDKNEQSIFSKYRELDSKSEYLELESNSSKKKSKSFENIGNHAVASAQSIHSQREYLNDPEVWAKNTQYQNAGSSLFRNGSQQKTLDETFKHTDSVKDPYTGNTLYRDKDLAMQNYGSEYTSHTPNADHTVPIDYLHDKHKDNPFLEVEDLKEIVNQNDNFQVISEKVNKSKGKKSTDEFLSDKQKREELGISDARAKTQRRKAKEVENSLENDLTKATIKRAAGHFHSAGKNGAIAAGSAVAIQSGIMNFVAVCKGEKNIKDAVLDTSLSTIKAAGTGYLTSGSFAVINRWLCSSNSPFIQALGKSNMPAKVVTGAMVIGGSVVAFCQGKITAKECMTKIAQNSAEFAVVGESSVIGQALIPIPVDGAVIGSMVGMALTSFVFGNTQRNLEKEREFSKRAQIRSQCDQMLEQMRVYEAELDSYLNKYFSDLYSFFKDSIDDLKEAMLSGNNDNVIASSNKFILGMGGSIEYSNTKEFKQFLTDSEEDSF